jgi:hypothetical protein
MRNQPYGDGRLGFGAEIDKFHTPSSQDRSLNESRDL